MMTAEEKSVPKVDVDALMEQVRAGVAGKLKSGLYTQAEIDEVSRLELSLKERAGFGLDIDEGIAFLNANWDPNGPQAITSHRPVMGRILVPAKTLLRKLLRPLASLILIKQTEFNGHVARLLTSALHSVMGLEARFQDLLLKHYELMEEHRELHKKHRELAADLDRNRALLDTVRRGSPGPVRPQAAPTGEKLSTGGTGAVSYLSFEDRHRGSSLEIKQKQKDYIKYFKKNMKVLDAGCGRGEFLELLAEAGLEAYGVDTDGEMVARCREKGLKVEAADVNSHLETLPDGSLGGVFAAQVAEHMETGELIRFVRLAWAKLAPGGVLVAETINPTCLATFAGAVYLDLSHTKPIHPEAMRFLMEASGFSAVEVLFRSPFPREMKLKEVDLFHRLQKFEDAFLNVVNDNFNQLNELIYGCQDYAVVGTK